MHVAQSCFENTSIQQFWSIADEYLDLVTRLHTQARLMSQFGLNAAGKHSPDICSGTSFFMPSNEKLRCAQKGLVICTTCPLLIFLS